MTKIILSFLLLSINSTIKTLQESYQSLYLFIDNKNTEIETKTTLALQEFQKAQEFYEKSHKKLIDEYTIMTQLKKEQNEKIIKWLAAQFNEEKTGAIHNEYMAAKAEKAHFDQEYANLIETSKALPHLEQQVETAKLQRDFISKLYNTLYKSKVKWNQLKTKCLSLANMFNTMENDEEIQKIRQNLGNIETEAKQLIQNENNNSINV